MPKRVVNRLYMQTHGSHVGKDEKSNRFPFDYAFRGPPPIPLPISKRTPLAVSLPHHNPSFVELLRQGLFMSLEYLRVPMEDDARA